MTFTITVFLLSLLCAIISGGVCYCALTGRLGRNRGVIDWCIVILSWIAFCEALFAVF